MKHEETELDSILAEFSDFSNNNATEAAQSRPMKQQPAAVTEVHPSQPGTNIPHAIRNTAHEEPALQTDSLPGKSHKQKHKGAHYVPAEPILPDEAAPESKPRKKTSKKQKRRRRNMITLILVCLLILVGVLGIYLTLTHESKADTVKGEINLTERIEKIVAESGGSASRTENTGAISES